MKVKEKVTKKKFNLNLYLPVFILAVAVTILVSGTFAWFVDNRHADGTITFASIALAPDVGFVQEGMPVKGAIPGSEILNGTVKFKKHVDSSSILVRAKIEFTRTADDNGSIPDFWIETINAAVHNTYEGTNYKWTDIQSDGYYYLVKKAGEGTEMYPIVKTFGASPSNDENEYILFNTLKFPIYYNDNGVQKPIPQLTNYAQYQQKLAIKVSIQAVQYENTNVQTVTDAIPLFAAAFPVPAVTP